MLMAFVAFPSAVIPDHNRDRVRTPLAGHSTASPLKTRIDVKFGEVVVNGFQPGAHIGLAPFEIASALRATLRIGPDSWAGGKDTHLAPERHRAGGSR
jgi:hypothetical protein